MIKKTMRTTKWLSQDGGKRLIWVISNASEREKHEGTRSEIKIRVNSLSTLYFLKNITIDNNFSGIICLEFILNPKSGSNSHPYITHRMTY